MCECVCVCVSVCVFVCLSVCPNSAHDFSLYNDRKVFFTRTEKILSLLALTMEKPEMLFTNGPVVVHGDRVNKGRHFKLIDLSRVRVMTKHRPQQKYTCSWRRWTSGGSAGRSQPLPSVELDEKMGPYSASTSPMMCINRDHWTYPQRASYKGVVTYEIWSLSYQTQTQPKILKIIL